jgi:formate hydrogenlyase transcriptional activator
MEIDTGAVWVSDKTRELFDFAPDEKLDDTSFYNAMYHEDRTRIKEVVEKAIQTGEHFSCEFRVVLPEGKIKWIAARGKRDQDLWGGHKRLLGVSLDISAGKCMEEQLEERLHQIEDLQERLEQENIYLQEEVKLLGENTDIRGNSKAIKAILSKARQVAETDSTVLILGATGTGKELLARAIHKMSLRKDRPLVTINCASLPPSLIENELFGREKGAYTGAMTKMVGRFELADGSTLFLDEIGELPLDLQSKLLRVIEEGQLERLGSTTPLNIDVRIIAATNRDIEQEVKGGRFRQDLYYRLNVFPILIPPLNERSEDIPILARAFAREFGKKMGKQIEKIPHKTLLELQSYSWPGNVRELRNIIERGMILTKDETLVIELPKCSTDEPVHTTRNLDDIIRREISAVLDETRWRIAGRHGAAEILGLKRSTLHSKMKKLGIQRTDS